MAKVCSCDGCDNPVFGGGYCKWHQNYRTDKKPKRPKLVSDKRKKENDLYKIVRDVYLSTHPVCEGNLSGCSGTPVELHHMMGRENDKLLDDRFFKALCHNCHSWCTEHSKEAIEMGLSVRRNG